MTETQTKEQQLGTAPIPKLLFTLAMPAVAAQLINVLYSVVDRIYLGNMSEAGDLALTGVGITFPILMIIAAFSAFVGMGGAPLASIKLGAGDKAGAEKILGNSLTMILCLSVLLTILGLTFKIPLLYAFGASDQLIGYANDYITIYLFGTIFVQIALGLNVFISAQGYAKVAMISVVLGAATNIILDPIFIFGFHMGVKGAALATILSQAVSAVWVLKFLFSKKSTIKIKKQNLKLNKKVISSIAMLGLAPFIMQSTESLVNITLNAGLQHYGGDLYVGSITIITSVMQLFIMPINGFAQGAQPIISYNYGAKNYDRVKQTFRLLLITTVSMSTITCLLTVIFPQIFVRMFTSKEQLFQLTCQMMPIFLGGIFAFGAQIACQSTFLALGQAKISLFLALLRKVFLLIPLAILLPMFFGIKGIYFSEPIADILAAVCTLSLFFFNYKKLLPTTELPQNKTA